MGKSFWKRSQSNWRSRRKSIKRYAYDAENTPFILKQKEKFNELVDERRGKITDLDKRVNSDDLVHRHKGNTADLKFDKFDNALNIINKIQNGEMSIVNAKNNQEKFKSYLGEIKKRKQKAYIKRAKKHCVQHWNALQNKKRSY